MGQRKKPCRFCRRWFRPAPQQRGRQYACSARECQAKRKAASQASWLAKNPGYFRGRAGTHRAYRIAHPERRELERARRQEPEVRERERKARARRRRLGKVRVAVEQEACALQLLSAPGDRRRVPLAAEQDAWEAQLALTIAVACRLPPAAEQDPIAGNLTHLHDWGSRLRGGLHASRKSREASPG